MHGPISETNVEVLLDGRLQSFIPYNGFRDVCRIQTHLVPVSECRGCLLVLGKRQRQESDAHEFPHEDSHNYCFPNCLGRHFQSGNFGLVQAVKGGKGFHICRHFQYEPGAASKENQHIQCSHGGSP